MSDNLGRINSLMDALEVGLRTRYAYVAKVDRRLYRNAHGVLAMSSKLMDEQSQKRSFRLTTALIWDYLEWSLYVPPRPLDVWTSLDFLFAVVQDKGVFHITVFDAHKLVEQVEADSYFEPYRRYPFRLIPDCIVDDYFINNETQEVVDARTLERTPFKKVTPVFQNFKLHQYIPPVKKEVIAIWIGGYQDRITETYCDSTAENWKKQEYAGQQHAAECLRVPLNAVKRT